MLSGVPGVPVPLYGGQAGTLWGCATLPFKNTGPRFSDFLTILNEPTLVLDALQAPCPARLRAGMPSLRALALCGTPRPTTIIAPATHGATTRVLTSPTGLTGQRDRRLRTFQDLRRPNGVSLFGAAGGVTCLTCLTLKGETSLTVQSEGW